MMTLSSKFWKNLSRDYLVAPVVKRVFGLGYVLKLRGPKLSAVNEDQKILPVVLVRVRPVSQCLVPVVKPLPVQPVSRGYRGSVHHGLISQMLINPVPISHVSRQAL
jgi:hypothetical protein